MKRIKLHECSSYNFICQLDSYDDEYDSYLRIGLLGRYVTIKFPNWILLPLKEKVKATNWDEETINRLGRDWYYNVYRRSFGICWFETSFTFYYGSQDHMECDKDKRFSISMDFMDYTYCGFELYTPDWTLVYSHKGDYESDRHSIIYDNQVKEVGDIEKVFFSFKDYDGEEVIAKCYIECRRWHLGRNFFRWLKYLSRSLVRYSIDIAYNKEVGDRKDTWKGGTLACGADIEYGENIEDAFIRYGEKNKFTNIKKLNPNTVDTSQFLY